MKPHIGKSATGGDKAGKYLERPKEVCGELRLVKGWFGIGQEVRSDILQISISFI